MSQGFGKVLSQLPDTPIYSQYLLFLEPKEGFKYLPPKLNFYKDRTGVVDKIPKQSPIGILPPPVIVIHNTRLYSLEDNSFTGHRYSHGVISILTIIEDSNTLPFW